MVLTSEGENEKMNEKMGENGVRKKMVSGTISCLDFALNYIKGS
jgi:hypothetical protein